MINGGTPINNPEDKSECDRGFITALTSWFEHTFKFRFKGFTMISLSSFCPDAGASYYICTSTTEDRC